MHHCGEHVARRENLRKRIDEQAENRMLILRQRIGIKTVQDNRYPDIVGVEIRFTREQIK